MPMTRRQWQDSLRQPALCELLPVRDYLDGCIVRTNGSFVAGYEASGLNTFFHADETRNRTKEVLEALVRSLPERSMRMQIRYEVTDGHGDLTERYVKEQRIENAVLQALDRERIRLWNTRQQEGHYLRRRLHVYFIWNPEIHHESQDFEWRKTRGKASGWSLSANKCIQRTFREHEDFLSEFESLMAGAQATLEATGMQPRRMTDQEMFLEVKRALNPIASDTRPYKQGLTYESARAQVANVNIEDEQDGHLKVGGLLYSWVSVKEMPDATFPGITRELVGQEFPARRQRGDRDSGSKQDHAVVQTTSSPYAGGPERYPWRFQDQRRGSDRTGTVDPHSAGCRIQLVEGMPTQSRRWVTHVQACLQFKGAGRSRADTCGPTPARPPRDRAHEWRPRHSGDAGAEADLYRDASRDGGRDKAGTGVPDAACGRPVAGRSPVARFGVIGDPTRNPIPADGAVFPVRCEPGRRQHADHGEERRRQDLHGAIVAAHAGPDGHADLDSRARRFLPAAWWNSWAAE